jgi:hypothetical protein
VGPLTEKLRGMDVMVLNPVTFDAWVFNRITGDPLWPIEERPRAEIRYARRNTWPTQPFPTKPSPYARQKFTVDDLSPYLSTEDRARNEGLFYASCATRHDSNAGQQRRSQLGRRRSRPIERHPGRRFEGSAIAAQARLAAG